MTFYCLIFFRSTAVSWPGRCSPTHVSAGANIMSTQPLQSCGNSSPRTRPRKNSARTRSCGWPCATSTSWWLCWRAREESHRLTRKPHSSHWSRGTCRTCAPTAPGPATPTRPHPGPAVTVQKPGRTKLMCRHSMKGFCDCGVFESSIAVERQSWIFGTWNVRYDITIIYFFQAVWKRMISGNPETLYSPVLLYLSRNPKPHMHGQGCTLEASPWYF